MSFGYFGMYKTEWYCRWCGKHTTCQKTERDGFCAGGKCKQAWWRAYHKWLKNVTPAGDRRPAGAPDRNATPSKKTAKSVALPSRAKRQIPAKPVKRGPQ